MDGLPDKVVAQDEVRMCNVLATLFSRRHFEQVGYKFAADFVIDTPVVRVLDGAGRHIGHANIEYGDLNYAIYANIAFDGNTPERLDAELDSLRALPRGKLRLPAQSVPCCLLTEEPMKAPLFVVEGISIESIVLTTRAWPGVDPVSILGP